MVVVVMEAVSIYLVTDIQRLLEQGFEEGLHNTATVLAHKLTGSLSDVEYVQQMVIDELKYQRPGTEYDPNDTQAYNILIFDDQYKPIFGAEGQYWVDSLLVDVAQQGTPYSSDIRQDPATGDRYQMFCLPIKQDEHLEGLIYIVASMKAQVDDKVKEIREILLMGTGLTVLITVVLGFGLAQTITKPIKELTFQAAAMSEGDFSQQITVRSDDEIGQLGKMFNSLTAQLSQTLGEISNEKSKLDAIFTYMSNGVIAFAVDGTLIHINPKAQELLHLADDNPQLLLNVKQRLEINDIKKTVSTAQPLSREVILNLSSRQIIRIQQAPFMRGGELSGVIMVLQDITEQQKLEQMRNDFIANVSHELKTPLTNIKGRVQTLLEYIDPSKVSGPRLIAALKAGWRMLDMSADQVRMVLPAEANDLYDLTYPQLKELYTWQVRQIQRKMLPVIEAETDRMNKLVRDLLQLSQLDSDKQKFQKKSFYMQALLSQVVERMGISAQEKQIELHFVPGVPLEPIYADMDSMEQVVDNIISNAIKYSPPQTRVEVSLKALDDFAQVCVLDHGIGIPKEDLPRIFERFYRVDKARSRQMGGTGLGLSIAKQIIEAHGGEISIHSEVDQGTKVCFTVPLKDEQSCIMND